MPAPSVLGLPSATTASVHPVSPGHGYLAHTVNRVHHSHGLRSRCCPRPRTDRRALSRNIPVCSYVCGSRAVAHASTMLHRWLHRQQRWVSRTSPVWNHVCGVRYVGHRHSRPSRPASRLCSCGARRSCSSRTHSAHHRPRRPSCPSSHRSGSSDAALCPPRQSPSCIAFAPRPGRVPSQSPTPRGSCIWTRRGVRSSSRPACRYRSPHCLAPMANHTTHHSCYWPARRRWVCMSAAAHRDRYLLDQVEHLFGEPL